MNDEFFRKCESWQIELLRKKLPVLRRSDASGDVSVSEVTVLKDRNEYGAPCFVMLSESGEKLWPDLYPKGLFEGAHGLLFQLKDPKSTSVIRPKYFFINDDEYEDEKSAAEFESIFSHPDERHKAICKRMRRLVLPLVLYILLMILSDILGICLSVFTEPGEYPVLLGMEGLAIILFSFLSLYYSLQSSQTDRRMIQICCITLAAMVIGGIDFAMMLITRSYLLLIIAGFVLSMIGHSIVIFLLTVEDRLLIRALLSRKYYISPAKVVEPVRQSVHVARNPGVRTFYRYYIRVVTEKGKEFRVHSTWLKNRRIKKGSEGTLVCVRNDDSSKTFYWCRK